MPMHGSPILQGTTLDSQTSFSECRTMTLKSIVSRTVSSGAVCQESEAREGSEDVFKVTGIRRVESESKGSPLRVESGGSGSRADHSGFAISSEDRKGPPHPESQHNPISEQMRSLHHDVVPERLLHRSRCSGLGPIGREYAGAHLEVDSNFLLCEYLLSVRHGH